MRTLVALTLVLAACGGPTKKTAAENTDTAAETCCCKYNPLTSDDGLPVYEAGNRMECSSKQGECVPDVQCEQQPEPE